jgi:hypothetical protein
MSLFMLPLSGWLCHSSKLTEGVTPMDLDNILSDTAFTFPKFWAFCVQRGICQRCGQQFDEAHKKVWGCILPDGQHMDIKRKIELFRQWSSPRGQLVSQIETIHPNYNPNRPRQSTSPNPLASISSGPAALDPTILTGSANRVILDQIPPLSLVDYCLDQAIDEMEVEPLNFCMSPDSYLSLPFSHSSYLKSFNQPPRLWSHWGFHFVWFWCLRLFYWLQFCP